MSSSTQMSVMAHPVRALRRMVDTSCVRWSNRCCVSSTSCDMSSSSRCAKAQGDTHAREQQPAMQARAPSAARLRPGWRCSAASVRSIPGLGCPVPGPALCACIMVDSGGARRVASRQHLLCMSCRCTWSNCAVLFPSDASAGTDDTGLRETESWLSAASSPWAATHRQSVELCRPV